MKTTEDIDRDIQTLHGALGTPGEEVHSKRKLRYIGGGLILVLFVVSFLLLSRTKDQIVTLPQGEEMSVGESTERDIEAEEYAAILDTVFTYALEKTVVSSGDEEATGMVPRILTWTPGSLGLAGEYGVPDSLSGTYTLPPGWVGLIHLLSGDEEIGTAFVDRREHGASEVQSFQIFPREGDVGGKEYHLELSAMNGCRVACHPSDELCRESNMAYCSARADNQAFLSYSSTAKESVAANGCAQHTFVVGPMYTPQMSEDYAMCERGEWGGDTLSDVMTWSYNIGLSQNDTQALANVVTTYLANITAAPMITADLGTSVHVDASYSPGHEETEDMCTAQITVKVNCPE